jgi:hypothetical protein
MKAKPFCLPILLALLLPLGGLAADQDYEKRLSETYFVNPDARVNLDNRYGEIKVVTWNQQRVKVDVLIRVDARSEDDFQETLERIDVVIRGGGSSVSATTTVSGNRSSNSWWDMITGGGGSDDFKIYYTVSMPASLQLDVKARYCDVELPDLSGPTYLNIGYGDLVGGRLTNRTELDVSYGSARIERIGNDSDVKMRYSEGSIRNAGDIRYDGRYSEIRLGRIGRARFDVGYEEIDIESATEVRLDGNYNELSVQRAGSIYLDGNYTDFNLGTVTGVLEVDGNYGDVEVRDLEAGFDHVRIRVSYSDVQIDVANNAGYTLDLRARYGDIDVPRNDLSPRNISNQGNTETVTGKKAGTGSGRIEIDTSYGDIEIY